MFAKQYENPGTLSNILSNGMIGFMLDASPSFHIWILLSPACKFQGQTV
jgi:hypothetical protein